MAMRMSMQLTVPSLIFLLSSLKTPKQTGYKLMITTFDKRLEREECIQGWAVIYKEWGGKNDEETNTYPLRPTRGIRSAISVCRVSYSRGSLAL